jgi:hypothetical protein
MDNRFPMTGQRCHAAARHNRRYGIDPASHRFQRACQQVASSTSGLVYDSSRSIFGNRGLPTMTQGRQ